MRATPSLSHHDNGSRLEDYYGFKPQQMPITEVHGSQDSSQISAAANSYIKELFGKTQPHAAYYSSE